MSFFGLLLIAIGVSADAFAVALTLGVKMREFIWKYALVIALFFGGFQALMPLIGWALGSSFLEYIAAFDHWVAFALLAVIGGKMLWEAFEPDHVEERLCALHLDSPDCDCESAGTSGHESGDHPLTQGGGGTALIVENQVKIRTKPAFLALGPLTMLAIAESIDALAVGITFPVYDINVWAAISLIGAVTFAISLAAVVIGHRLGSRFSKPAEIIGGLILIGLGLQVLFEHLG